MATLEKLIAQGRRVRRPREQRESAFGLAEFSTQRAALLSMVQKGAITSLLHLLERSLDALAHRYSTLALANIASDDAARPVLGEEGCIRPLLQFISREDSDPVGRQYAAMAIGNCAKDPSSHEEIVKLDGLDILLAMLKLDDVNAGRYAAFALSNLAYTKEYRFEIVERGAISSLVTLASCDEVEVQRQALACLRACAVSPDIRPVIVREGALDALVLMSRSPDRGLRCEVAAAFANLSSMDENKLEVALRAMGNIQEHAMSGDPPRERAACSTMANLLELVELHDRFVASGGLIPLVAMLQAVDAETRSEACRALSNLAFSPRYRRQIVDEGALRPMVRVLEAEHVGCQRYASLALGNLAAEVELQARIIQEGSVAALVRIAGESTRDTLARRYAVFVLSNLTAQYVNHAAVVGDGALQALYSLSNSADVKSQYFSAYTLSNLASSERNHARIVEEGGLQPLISLIYSKDVDVRREALAALRGLAVDPSNRMKIVQEGGLGPMLFMTRSSDILVLRQVSATFSNLALSDENKFEIVKSGAVRPLLDMAGSHDKDVSHYACAALASLAEMAENQLRIAEEGGIKALIAVLRSPHVEVQRESGRAIANLAASRAIQADIVAAGGVQLLISHLLSPDTASQRVGALGISNLATNPKHRMLLIDSAALEPLMTLARSEDVELEIQRFAVLAIANLATSPENHARIVEEGALPLLISLSDSPDDETRQFAAFSLVMMARNAEVRKRMTEEGGLEPVLFLARTDNTDVHLSVLPALCTMSFEESNKLDITKYGGLAAVVPFIDHSSADTARLACATVGNLAEVLSNQRQLVLRGAIPRLVASLSLHARPETQREAARALGNLAVNVKYAALIVEAGGVPPLVKLLTLKNVQVERMAARTLCNLAVCASARRPLVEAGVLDPLAALLRIGLNSKKKGDALRERFLLITLANIVADASTHRRVITAALPLIFGYARARDVKSRHYAIFAMGNLASSPKSIRALVDVGAMAPIISYAFPGDVDAQFQAIAALRGLAVDSDYRLKLVEMDALQPLVLAASSEDLEVQREVAAAFSNISLSQGNKLSITRAGGLPALLTLARSLDPERERYAVTAMANMAEMLEGRTQRVMMDEGILSTLLQLARSPYADIRAEVARALACFASKETTHPRLRNAGVFPYVVAFIEDSAMICQRFGTLGAGHLAMRPENHPALLEARLLSSLNAVVSTSTDVDTLRSAAYAFNNVTTSELTWAICHKMHIEPSLVNLLRLEDEETHLQAAIATQRLSRLPVAREELVKQHALSAITLWLEEEDIVLRCELTATIRNLSLSPRCRRPLVAKGALPALTKLVHDADDAVAAAALGALASLAEEADNQLEMVESGVLQHLKYSISQRKVIHIRREAVRCLGNMAADPRGVKQLGSAGAVLPGLELLSVYEDAMTQRWAAMALGNLAVHADNQMRIAEEGGLAELVALATGKNGDRLTRLYALVALCNVAATPRNHDSLLQLDDLIPCISTAIHTEDEGLRNAAAFTIANLASVARNHGVLISAGIIEQLVALVAGGDSASRRRATSALRGLAVDEALREEIIRAGALPPLLSLSGSKSPELQREVLAALCNLSLTGCIGADPGRFVGAIVIDTLIRYLTTPDNTYRLFGAITLGNAAASAELLPAVEAGGALAGLLSVSSSSEFESLRAVAFALINLLSNPRNVDSILDGGGLLPLLALCVSDDLEDQRSGLATVRGLAARPVARRPLMEADVLEAMSHAAGTEDVSCSRETATTLYYLTLQDELKSEIAEHEVAAGLVHLASGTALSVTLPATEALANLLEVAATHATLCDMGIIRALHSLARRAMKLLAADAERELIEAAETAALAAAGARAIRRRSSTVASSAAAATAAAAAVGDGGAAVTLDDDVTAAGAAAAAAGGDAASAALFDLPLALLQLRAVARAFANLACNYDMHGTLTVGRLEQVSLLLSMCTAAMPGGSADDALLRRSLLTALANLALRKRTVSSLPDAVRDHVLQSLSEEAEPDATCREMAALATAALAREPAQHLPLVSSGALMLLGRLLPPAQPLRTRYHSAFALARIARSPAMHLGMEFEGLLPLLVRLAYVRQSAPRLMALHAVRKLAEQFHAARNAMMAVDEDGRDVGTGDIVRASEAVQRAIKSSSSSDTMLLRECASIAYNVLLSSAVRDASLTERFVDSLMTLAQSSDVEIARQAGAALANLAETTRSHAELHRAGILQLAVVLLRARHRDVCQQAARLLVHLLSDRGCHAAALKDIDFLPNLAHLSVRSEWEARFSAACCWLHLCSNRTVQKAVLKGGAVRPLIKLADASKWETRLHAMHSLCLLAANPELMLDFTDRGGMEAMLDLLPRTVVLSEEEVKAAASTEAEERKDDGGDDGKSASPAATAGAGTAAAARAGAAAAATGAGEVAAGEEAVVEEGSAPVGERGGDQSLAGKRTCLAEGSAIVLATLAMTTLRHLTLHKALKRRLVELGGIPIVRKCCWLTENNALLRQGAGVFLNLAELPGNQLVVAKEAMTALRRLAAVLVADVQIDVARAVAHLSSNDENATTRFGETEYRMLFSLMTASDEACRRFAGMAMSNLVARASNQIAAVRAGGIRPLVHLLARNDSPACRALGARSLYRLAAHSGLQLAIVEGNALPRLQSMLESDDEQCRLTAVRACCNLSTHHAIQKAMCIVGTLGALLQLLDRADGSTASKRFAAMALTNLATHASAQLEIARARNLPKLVAAASHSESEVRRYAAMALANLSSSPDVWPEMMSGRRTIAVLVKLVTSPVLESSRAAALALYNLSIRLEHLPSLALAGAGPALIAAAGQGDLELRRHAVSALVNLAGSLDTRDSATRGGGLQTLVVAAGSDSAEVRRYATLALGNLAAAPVSREAVLIHGGLRPVMAMLRSDDVADLHAGIRVLSNLAASPDNQAQLLQGGVVEMFVRFAMAEELPAVLRTCATFGLVNMTSEERNVDALVRAGALPPLLSLASQHHPRLRAVGLSAVRIISRRPQHGPTLMRAGALDVLVAAAWDRASDVLRELAPTITNLAALPELRQKLAGRHVLQLLLSLSSSEPPEVARHAAGALAWVAEADETHGVLLEARAPDALVRLMWAAADHSVRRSAGHRGGVAAGGDAGGKASEGGEADKGDGDDAAAAAARPAVVEDRLSRARRRRSSAVATAVAVDSGSELLNVQREALRASAALLTSFASHDAFLRAGLSPFVKLGCLEGDAEVAYAAALAMRKLMCNDASHRPLVKAGALRALQLLVGSEHAAHTRVQAAAALRDLAADADFKEHLVAAGALESLVRLAADESVELQFYALSALRHLSVVEAHQQAIVDAGVLPSLLLSSLSDWLPLLQQCAALLANLSTPLCNLQRMVSERGCVPALVYLSGIDDREVAQDAARALAHLAACLENQMRMWKEGGLHCLLQLAGSSDWVCQHYSAVALRMLAENPRVRLEVVRGGLISDFLRLSRSDVLELQRTAAVAFASFTLNESNKLKMVQDGGLAQLLTAIQSEDGIVSRAAASALGNMLETEEYHKDVLAAGGLPTIVRTAMHTKDSAIQDDAARCMSFLSMNGDMQAAMIEAGALPLLLLLLRRTDRLATTRHAALALFNLCVGEEKVSVVTAGAHRALLNMARHSDVALQRQAALAMGGLALGGRGRNRETIVADGCVKPLVQLASRTDEAVLNCAALALAAIGMGDYLPAKDAVMLEEGLLVIMSLAEASVLPIARAALFALGCLAESREVRLRLLELGVINVCIRRAAALDDVDVRRHVTYTLALYADDDELHDRLVEQGALHTLIASASLEDVECQEYAAFSLAHLSGNRDNQTQLVEEGALLPLVSMMAVHSGARHYAGLALLKLSDSWENHAKLAEAGAIQALLGLARARTTERDLQYRAALAVGHLASNVAHIMPKEVTGAEGGRRRRRRRHVRAGDSAAASTVAKSIAKDRTRDHLERLLARGEEG
eukprot:PLAT3273.9.p1 GENE.PLAT3273.9~~PLAT3273.9.p1  ORF type:complete len:3983 (+),score=2360.32 PLAT3273.9:40-11988(+)